MELTKLQKQYYDMQVKKFSMMRMNGRRIAIPYGLIEKDALSKSDYECAEILAINNQAPNIGNN